MQQQPVVGDSDALKVVLSSAPLLAIRVSTGRQLSLSYSVAGRSTRLSQLAQAVRFAQLYILLPTGSLEGGAYFATAAQLVQIRCGCYRSPNAH